MGFVLIFFVFFLIGILIGAIVIFATRRKEYGRRKVQHSFTVSSMARPVADEEVLLRGRQDHSSDEFN